jgi:hypothetical protein
MIFKDLQEKDKLYRQVRVSLGEPVRDYGDWVTDEVIETYIEMAIEDYISYLDNWLIEQQWSSLDGLNISTTNFVEAFTTRTLDFEKSFAIAYGKQTGISTLGEWELKSDYVTISANTQVYSIPSGREINEILWYTPPQVATNILDPIGIGGAWFGAPTGWFYGNTPAQAMLPSFSLILSTMDRLQKKKIIQSELSYRIAPGPNKTKNLFLYPIPGSRDEIVGRFGKTQEGSKVWYFYYDTTPENVDQCLAANPDIIRYPNQVDVGTLDYSSFNQPTKAIIRQLFIAEAKKALGRVRGKFGGIVGPPEAERTMDYESLISEGNEERKAVMEKLEERMTRFTTTSQLERSANEAENLNKSLTYRPLGFWVY